MKYPGSKLKLVTLFAIIIISLGFNQSVHAESVFYSNIKLGVQNTVSYYNIGPDEIADDVPFTGSHQVSTFRFGYRSSDPVHATFRFYGVDPTTGFPGQLIAQFGRDFPASDFARPIINLDASEQFTFTAEPGLFAQDVSGGWFSVQFESPTGLRLPYNLAVELATGSSQNGFYNVTSGNATNILDASGIIPVSLFLELFGTQIDGGTPPSGIVSELTSIELTPSTIAAGTSTVAKVNLSSLAPKGGFPIKLSANNKAVSFSSANISVAEGEISATVTIFVSSKAAPKGKKDTRTITITAEASNSKVSTYLNITR